MKGWTMYPLSNAMSPSDYTYYGQLKNGGLGYGNDISKFSNVTGAIDPTIQNNGAAQQYGTFGASSGIQRNPIFGGILDSYRVDPKTGAMIKDAGWGNLGLGLAGLGLNWWLGNKQMDLGREQLDFSKDQFWNNYMAQMDEANYARNQAIRNHELANYRAANPNDNAGYAAYNENLQDTMDTGEVRYKGNGEVSNLTNPQGYGYTGQGYGQNPGTVTQPSAFAASQQVGSQIPDYMRAENNAQPATMSSTNPTEASKSTRPETVERTTPKKEKDKEKNIVRRRTIIRQ